MGQKSGVVNFILTLWRETDDGKENWRGTLRPISPRLEDKKPEVVAFIGLSALSAAVKAGLHRMSGGGGGGS